MLINIMLPILRHHIVRLTSSRLFTSFCEKSMLDGLRSSTKNVILDRSNPNGVAVLAMNYQKRKNALSKFFVEDMSTVVSDLEKDTKTKILIICSLVNNVFCAGADLRERAQLADADVPALVGGLRHLFHRVYRLAMPTVAAIDGAALGGGLELALACDIRYAGNLPACRIGLIETHWALLPGAGGSQRLPRIIPVATAKELMFAARRMSPTEAVCFGVVNQAVDPASVPEEWRDRPSLYHAFEYAKEVCTKGPIAVRQLKRAVNEGLDAGSLEQGLAVEGECYKVLTTTKDRREGMAAFMERRQPIYHGH